MKKLLLKLLPENLKNKLRKIRSRYNFENKIFYINTKDELNKICEKYLINLLLHAYHNVPYYSQIFDKIGLIRKNKVDLSRFSEIPILTKNTIRKHHSKLISKDCNARRWFYNSSGGSTGEPIRLIQDDIYKKWEAITQKYYYENMLDIHREKVKKIILWGSEKDIFKSGDRSLIKFENGRIFLNSFVMDKENLSCYVKIINAYKPDFFRGYAGSLYELCKYVKDNKLTLYSPKILVSSAEMLRKFMRKIIEEVFRTKVYDFYGSREVNTIAAECKNGSIHAFMFNNYTEILDNFNKKVKNGEEGKIVITNLHNYSMPLIRYEIGDTAVLESEPCDCGSFLPTIKKITGRITEHFIKKDGTIVHGEYFTHLFYLKDWVKAFEILQEDYEKIKILVVLNGLIKEFEKEDIENKMKIVMGHGCEIIWEFIDKIPKTPSGKYIYTKSLIR